MKDLKEKQNLLNKYIKMQKKYKEKFGLDSLERVPISIFHFGDANQDVIDSINSLETAIKYDRPLKQISNEAWQDIIFE